MYLVFTIAALHFTSVAYTQMLTSVCKEYHQLLSAVAIVTQGILHFAGVCCDANLLLWALSSQILSNTYCVLHILGGLLFDTHLLNN